MKTLLVPMAPRLMVRCFAIFLAREVAIIGAGLGGLMLIPGGPASSVRHLTHAGGVATSVSSSDRIMDIAAIVFVTVGAAAISALSQRYTYLLSDRGIFTTTLAKDPRVFRRALALWARDRVRSFATAASGDEFHVTVTLESRKPGRQVLLRFPVEDEAKLRREFIPLMEQLQQSRETMPESAVRGSHPSGVRNPGVGRPAD